MATAIRTWTPAGTMPYPTQGIIEAAPDRIVGAPTGRIRNGNDNDAEEVELLYATSTDMLE